MAYFYYNPNPWRLSTEDCAPRALSAVLRMSWHEAYDLLCESGREMGLMPSNKAVMWAILKMHGFRRHAMPDQCPDCYTISNFAWDHPSGVYVCATGDHIVAVIDGDWYDAWNSCDEIPQFFWEKY